MPDLSWLVPLAANTVPKAITAGVAKVCERLAQFAMTKGKDEWDKWQVEGQIGSISEKMHSVTRVKTLLSFGHYTDLSSFFVVPELEQAWRGGAIVKSMDAVFSGKNVLIRGTAGQGKSMLLRYQAAKEMALGVRLPIFAELRKLKKSEPLVDFLLREAEALGFSFGEELFHDLCRAGLICVYLDAFDEVLASERMAVLADLERLVRRHFALTVIVTARPGSGVDSVSDFTPYSLSYLKGRQYEAYVRQYLDDVEMADRLVRGVAEFDLDLILTTPLMVSLLVLQYRGDEYMPRTEIQFYENLFLLLSRQHDSMKQGYEREGRSSLVDTDLRKVFCGVAYLSKRLAGSMTYLAMVDVADKVIRGISDIEERGQNALDDIIQGTNLILEEGGVCWYPHKTVQEYHASEFVRLLSEEKAAKFYGAMARDCTGWWQELHYLSRTDRYRYRRYFEIPCIERLLELEDKGDQGLVVQCDVIDGDHLISFFKDTAYSSWEEANGYWMTEADDRGGASLRGRVSHLMFEPSGNKSEDEFSHAINRFVAGETAYTESWQLMVKTIRGFLSRSLEEARAFVATRDDRISEVFDL